MKARASHAFALLTLAFFLIPGGVFAGTTGGTSGVVTDAVSGTPIGAATVTVTSPSQSLSSKTDGGGRFTFASLAPDEYTIYVRREGYESLDPRTIPIFADQISSLSIKLLKKVLTEIGSVRSASRFAQPGITSTLSSIDASAANALHALSGAGSTDQLYGAMNAVPGILSPQGQSGWYQTLYIRGGDQDQAGYEYDGIPVARRDWQNAPVVNFSKLGLQQLQVYTGGILSTSEATGISGYVNQVVKSGTNPGFTTVQAGTGAPGFYHSLQIETGKDSPSFSYYVGTLAANSSFRYINQSNGAGLRAGFFYPVQLQSPGATQTFFDTGQQVYNGSPGWVSAPGNVYGIASVADRENVANVHIHLPHKHSALKDDIQIMWMESEMFNSFYSSLHDYNGPWPTVNGGAGLAWQDGTYYGGPVFAPPQAGLTRTYSFPSSPAHPFGGPLPASQPDRWSTQGAITKLQYQHNINADSYIRIMGYTTYSDWLLNAPASLNFAYGLEAADWEPVTHTVGTIANFASQIGTNNFLSISASYERTKTRGWSSFGLFGQPTTPITNYIDRAGNCYNPGSGAVASCFDPTLRGTIASPTLPVTAPAGSVAMVNGARWITTETGENHLFWAVTPTFTAVAINDQWRPGPRWNVNLGLRLENFRYQFGDTSSAYPARTFWFAAYNREHCSRPGLVTPVVRAPGAACPAGMTPTDVTNQGGDGSSASVAQPRIGFTYTINNSNVLRGSYGVYARPPATSWMHFDGQMQDLASFLGNSFLYYGFKSPVHALRPDRSYNVDLSWEHEFRGTTIGMKITPFIRSTADQQQLFEYDAVLGLTSGLNVGHQTSTGIELLLSKGNLTDPGWNWRLAYTHIRSRIKYSNFPSGFNVVDGLNNYIQEFNSYTSACAAPNPALCGSFNGHAVPVSASGVANPYYNSAPQRLFDRNGEYTTYDIFPAPFVGDHGYEVPDFGSLTVSYNHKRWSLTPSLTFSSGASYGNPLSWPGYDPASCRPIATTTSVDPTTCTRAIFIPNPWSGSFDTLGAYKQPWRLSGNLQIGYAISNKIHASLSMTHLFDLCRQRSYPWDAAYVCTYTQLPSNVLPPAGNFSANPPPELKYPYAAWNSNLNTDYLGVTVPFQAVFTVEFKL